VSTHRGVPDISADADPRSGFPVLCTVCGGWFTVGGTSVSSPLLAAMTNLAAKHSGAFAPSSTAELYSIYADLGEADKFYDVETGTCGAPAAARWDVCTGIGTPRTVTGLESN